MRNITSKFAKILSAAALAIGAADASASLVGYAGQGTPIIGAKVIATGGDVIAKFVNGSGAYDNYLYLAYAGSPYENGGGIGANWIFQNHLSVTGDTVNLGNFTAGTELIFNVVSDTHGGGLLNWYTGDSSRNGDGFAHAFVDSTYSGSFGGTMVGFEDLYGLGDSGYEDIRYTFSNVRSGDVPEPATLALLGLGLAGFGVARMRKA